MADSTVKQLVFTKAGIDVTAREQPLLAILKA